MKQSTNDFLQPRYILTVLVALFFNSYLAFGQPGDPSEFGDEEWTAYCFNGFNQNNYRGFFTMASLDFDTRDYYDEDDVPSNATGYSGQPITGWFHSMSLKRQGFECGQYTISIPEHIGFGTIYVDGASVFTHNWFAGSAGAVWSGYLGPNSTVEYEYRKLFGESFCMLEFEMNNGATTVWDGSASDDWFDDSNWSDGAPDETLNAQITVSGTAPSINGSGALAKSIIIDGGATLTVAAGESLLIYGNLDVDGALNAHEATLQFESACPNASQEIDAAGPLTVDRLEKLGTGSLTNIGSQLLIASELSITAGTFDSGDAVTLLSDADGTACLGPLGSGTVFNGNITAQRYVSATSNGWVQLGTPVSGQTLADWNDDLLTTGFPGSDYPNFNFNNVRLYDESLLGEKDEGLYFASDINDPVEELHGYQVYLAAGTMTVDVTGPPIRGTQDFAITYHSSEALYGSTFSEEHDGWNLVSNPYASAINWDDPSGWVKTNITGAIYVWDASIGQYNTYANGVGTNGGSNIIPSSQAFWVQANDNAPSLVINESAKSSSQGEFKMEQPKSVMHLTLSGGSGFDQVAFSIIEDDSALPKKIQKIYSPEAVPKLGIVGDNGIDWAIQFVSLQEATSLSLNQAFPQSGTYTIEADLTDYSTINCIYLEDLETGTWTDLRESGYNFEAQASEIENRFVLHFGAPLTFEVNAASCYASQDGSISFNAANDWLITLSNTQSGEEIELIDGQADGLAGGDYILSVSSTGQCALNVEQEIVIETPSELEVELATENSSCHNTADGALALVPYGGNAPYTVEWADGYSGLQRSNTGAGTYYYELIDSLGCSKTGSVDIDAETTISASFTLESSDLTVGEQISVINTSEGADSFTWNFGNGEATTYEYEPEWMYTEPGTYYLMLLAESGECIDIHTEIVSVSEVTTSVTEVSMPDNLNIYSDGSNVVIAFNFEQYHTLQIDVLNLLGQTIVSPRYISGQDGIERIPVDEKGVLIVRLTDENSGESVQGRIFMR